MNLMSIAAVAAGVGANLLAIPVDVTLQTAGLFPAPGQDFGEVPYAIAAAYRAAFAVLGGWVTARVAPSSPMKHAWVLGGLGVLSASLGAMGQWHLGHHWYPLALIALSLPATWAGARICVGGQR